MVSYVSTKKNYSVQQRYHTQGVIMEKSSNAMHLKLQGIVRIDKEKLFSPAKVSYTRGHHGKIFKRHALKTARKNSFSQRVINDWNSLPTDVIESPSIDIYKNRLDKHWQHLHYVTLD